MSRIKAVQISSSVGEVLAYAGDISALVDSAGSQQHYYFVSDVTFRDIAGGRVELLLESNELPKTPANMSPELIPIRSSTSGSPWSRRR